MNANIQFAAQRNPTCLTLPSARVYVTLCMPAIYDKNPRAVIPANTEAGRFKVDPRLKSASDRLARLKRRSGPLASVSRASATGDPVPSSKADVSVASGDVGAALLPSLFDSRLLAVNRDCAALSSICHSLVATGSSQPNTLASQRILAVLTPFSFS